MASEFSLKQYDISAKDIRRNPTPAELYEDAIKYDGSLVTNTGALVAFSGSKTGRSPKDKRIVEEASSSADIWWSHVNIKVDQHTFLINRERAVDYLNICDRIYVIDGFAGWDPKYRLKIRVICSRPYHALFMYNMLIRPTTAELGQFGDPDYTIYNAGRFPCNKLTSYMTSKTSVDLDFSRKEFVILGTDYAGEMKKGVFTIMNYLMPKRGVLSMHCSVNEGENKTASIFFGLSGTGKTTLSADPKRKLIGDDEHCWSDDGLFNIEGGCYAKCDGLSKEKEPEIFDAIRFGALLENVVVEPKARKVDYNDLSITQNTRASYPIDYIANVKVPCMTTHANNIIFLTCDAFGVLPPVSRLTPEQASYHFMSGYTAKVAGTEMGVTEPEATFSACFGAAFMVWHPSKYAEMLADKMRKHTCQAWLVNTGWSGGAYGVGSRMKLAYTRSIIDSIHNGSILKAGCVKDPIFGVEIPNEIPGVPKEILTPRNTWKDPKEFDATAKKLARLFHENFKQYESQVSREVLMSGPQV